MYLSKLQIKNFRNLEDVTISLGEKVVLLGENGSGKSNLIEALRILLDSSYRATLGENDFSRNGSPPFRGRKIEIHAWFSGIDPKKDKDLLTAVHDCHASKEGIYQISAVYHPRRNIAAKDATTEDDYELIRFGGGNNKNTQGAKRFRQYVRMVTIPAVRDLERDMQRWRTSPLRRLVEMLNLTTNPGFKDVADRVEKASKQLQGIAPIKEMQQKIQDVLGNLVEGAIKPTIEIAGANTDDLLRLLTLLAEPNLPVEHSSLGISNVLYLVTWLIYAEYLRENPGKNDQKPEYILFAIEEPEAHLHPHYQRLIFENVFKREHLLLVSTHSPTIVSVANPRHFVVLEKSDSGARAKSTACFASFDMDDTKNQDNWQKDKDANEKLLRDISRFLDATRGEVVFARGVLLVEGDAEMFLVPAFANVLAKERKEISHSLDGAGISVCNVYGTDFRPYVEFLGPSGLDLPLAVLTDGDPEEDPKNHLRKFAGVERGLALTKIMHPDYEPDAQIYDDKNPDNARTELEKLGIFVNGSTLEVELIHAGYTDEFCEVYGELGASERQITNFKNLIEDGDFDKMIERIKRIGGKGRFAQRLADKLDADRVPPYIEKAIRYLLNKVPANTGAPSLLPVDAEKEPESDDFIDDIPF